ncbi:MAG: hypothetical protein ACE5OZ_16725 [Candidatus Heimdallarchaeota archaeon]
MLELLEKPLRVGTGKTAVCANWILIGEDLLVVLSGEGRHIGGCSLAEPYTSQDRKNANISSISCKGHQDIEITRLIAQKVSKQLERVVAVVGGIHVDNASKKEINQILANAQTLGDRLIDILATSSTLE